MIAELRLPLASTDRKRRGFAAALLLATWVPLIFFTAIGAFGTTDPGAQMVRSLLLFLGLGHVPATLLLYVDRDFLRLVRTNTTRYVYLPLALILASGVVFTIGGHILQVSVFLAFVGWQAYHYGRQNVGVYTFAGVAHGWRPEPRERRALELTTLCGVCGTFKVLGADAAPPYLRELFEVLYRAGAIAFVVVVIFGVYVFVKNGRPFRLSKSAFFFTLLLFFMPLFVSSGRDVAFFSYAIAHGFQYLVFVAVLSVSMGMREGRRGVSGVMVVLTALIVSVGVVGNWSADFKSLAWIGSNAVVAPMIDFAAGIGAGVTMAHFVIDAGAWKLSRPAVRSYMATRFSFLYEAPWSSPPVPARPHVVTSAPGSPGTSC